MLSKHILLIHTALHNSLLHYMLLVCLRPVSTIQSQASCFPILLFIYITSREPLWYVYHIKQYVRHDANIRTKYCHFADGFAFTKAVLVLGEEVAHGLTVRRT
jgi:hypothetical protein